MNELLDIASEIRSEHDAAQRSASEAVAHATRAGELLLEARAVLPHGQFLPWLAANVEFGERTAQGYMKLAKLTDEKRNAVADLSLRGALRELRAESAVAKRQAVVQRFADKQRALADLPSVPRGAWSYRVIRNNAERRWGLQALPNASCPLTETVYFAVLDDETDRGLLLVKDAEVLIDYFFDYPTCMAVVGLDVNGDVRDLDKARWTGGRHPWPSGPGHHPYGWTRCGNECGPDLLSTP